LEVRVRAWAGSYGIGKKSIAAVARLHQSEQIQTRRKKGEKEREERKVHRESRI
jgi:hypothetical protein